MRRGQSSSRSGLSSLTLRSNPSRAAARHAPWTTRSVHSPGNPTTRFNWGARVEGRPCFVQVRSYPSESAARITRARVSAATSPRRVSAREAVVADTPATTATSRRVGRLRSVASAITPRLSCWHDVSPHARPPAAATRRSTPHRCLHMLRRSTRPASDPVGARGVLRRCATVAGDTWGADADAGLARLVVRELAMMFLRCLRRSSPRRRFVRRPSVARLQSLDRRTCATLASRSVPWWMGLRWPYPRAFQHP